MEEVIEADDPYHVVMTKFDIGKDRICSLISLTRIANNTEKVSNTIIVCTGWLFTDFEKIIYIYSMKYLKNLIVQLNIKQVVHHSVWICQ